MNDRTLQSHRIPLTRAVEAWRYFDSRQQTGKVVISIS